MLTIIDKTDDYEIIGNGSFITFNQKPIRLKIVDDNNDPDPVYIDILFNNDTSINKPEMKLTAKDKVLQFNLTNYNNVLGSGTARPQKIGILDNKIIYINIRCYAFNETSDKLLFYTLYKAVDNELEANSISLEKHAKLKKVIKDE